MTHFKPQLPIEKMYFLVYAIVGFIIPLFVTIISYTCINDYVRKASQLIRRNDTRVHNRRSHRSTSKTIMIFLTTTAINFSPYILWLILRIIELPLNNMPCRRLKSIADAFVFMTPVTNSLIYSIYGTNFRKDVKRAKNRLYSKLKLEIIHRVYSVRDFFSGF